MSELIKHNLLKYILYCLVLAVNGDETFFVSSCIATSQPPSGGSFIHEFCIVQYLVAGWPPFVLVLHIYMKATNAT